VLKLVYNNLVFGPIDLEYERPIVRVGSSEDNDLVLRHSSVEPYHCLLVFQGERVLCLPPSEQLPSLEDLPRMTGAEYRPGDIVSIGELTFSLEHSAKTIALPEVCVVGTPAGIAETVAPVSTTETNQPRYYCPHCRTFIEASGVKRVGLVGHIKRNLCPKCSNLLEAETVSRDF
jgi:hypothetical protein